jgi:hypothetical protein
MMRKGFFKQIKLSVVSTLLAIVQVSISHAQLPPGLSAVYDLSTNALLGVIETQTVSGIERRETWKLLQPQYPNQNFRVRTITQAEYDSIAAQSVLTLPQLLEYRSPPNSSAISQYPTLASLVSVSLMSSQVLEYQLTRRTTSGSTVVQGAMYREILMGTNGINYVRDTWRLFSNYVFPQGATELRVQQLQSGASANVRSFLTKHATKGGSWVVLSPSQNYLTISR